MTNNSLKLFIDTDPGIDDCHAIMMALSYPNVEIVGISIVSGNTTLENGIRNIHYLLNAFKRNDIPIFRGADRAINGHQKYAPHVHGDDGFGNVTKDKQIDLIFLSEETAAAALVRLAREHRNELVIAAIGPLTNIFLAQRLDSKFSENLKSLYIMGGNCTVPKYNTVSIGIEFNFACDPMAASRVLEEFQTRIRIVTFELTCMATIPFEIVELKMLSLKSNPNNRKAHLFAEVSQFLIDFTKQWENKSETFDGFNSCDSVCMACVLEPSIIKETKRVFACVEPFGQIASGHMISDWYNHFKREANVEIITDINKERFIELFQLCVQE